MNAIFDKIYTDNDGNDAPLPPLVAAMKYMYEDKQTNAIDGSKGLPNDVLNAELFYPQRDENIETNYLVEEMSMTEVAPAILKEFRDPKKALSDYVSAVDGKYSWQQTTEDEHQASLGKNATNDPAESPFAQLTRQLQVFGRVLGIHASAVGQARINGDFKRSINGESQEGEYFKLTPEMRESLMGYALLSSPAVRKEEKVQLNIQREAKLEKQRLLREKKMLACQREYGDKLTYIEMSKSQRFWNTKAIASKEYKKLESKTAKLNAVKEQIKIRVIGFGWKDLHHAWSQDGTAYSPDQLFKYLVDTLIPQQSVRGIPNSADIDLPSRKAFPTLGQTTADVARLDQRYEDEKEAAIEAAIEMRDRLEADGVIDRHEKMQPARPDVDENLIGAELEILYSYDEPDGSTRNMWCQGIVVAVRTNNRIHIEWDASTLRDGDIPITEETLLKSKYNKHVVGGWRYSID